MPDDKARMPHFGSGEGMWRYRALLPDIDREVVEQRVFMGEGGTPLLRARRIERDLGCREVWLKDETRNPTGSFKDRGTALGIAVLVRLGFTALGTVSTGNMARSVAAYAARAGMEATIWVGASMPAQKLAPIAVHGARLLRIDAPYGEIYNASIEWSRRSNVPFVNSDSALRVEGQKTIAYEIAEQLGGRAPDWLIVPTSSGGNFSAIAKGFQEAAEGGWLGGHCRLVAVQSAECDPIVRGWEAGSDEPIAVPPPTTVAGAISNPSPPSGARALRWLRRTDGRALAIPDTHIEAAQLRLASSAGRFAQPASAACLAALERLRDEDVVKPDDSVVLLLTGSGSNAPPPAVEVAEARLLADVMGELDRG
ncbi:MAG: threonine synthase [Acidobacteria bacterium]|nr:threonine synthase [Acidobacteriota bacterium]